MKYASEFLNPASKRKSIAPTEAKVRREAAKTRVILEELEEDGIQFKRPQYRYECPVQRPCPFVGCRYNLFLDITDTGNIKFNFYGTEPWEMKSSCAIDIADDFPGGLSLTEVGEYMGLTRERVRQIEKEALAKLAQTVGKDKIQEWLRYDSTFQSTQRTSGNSGD